MALIPALVVFAPGTKIKSAEANSNFDAIKTAFNASAVLTDVSRTITVAHTFAADILFTDASFDIGKAGATRPRDGFFSRNVFVGNDLTATNRVVTPKITAGGSVVLEPAGGFGIIFNNGGGISTWQFNSSSHFLPSADNTYDIGIAGTNRVRSIFAVTFTGNVSGNVTGNLTGNLTGTVLTASQGNITSLGILTSLSVSGSGQPVVSNNTGTAVNFRELYTARRGGVDHWHLGLNATDEFVLENAAGSAANIAVTDAGVVTLRGTINSTMDGVILSRNVATATIQYGQFLNTTGGIAWGIEGAAGGTLIVGSTGYDAVIRSKQGGISFSTNDGATLHARLAAGTLSLSGRVLAAGFDLTANNGEIHPGTTSFRITNNAVSANNLLMTDAGDVTWRGAHAGMTTLSLAGPISITTASSRIIAGATDFAINNNANSQNNFLITDAGNATIRGTLVVSGASITGSLSGNVTGNVTGNLTGTVLTASQTNITAVGTLGSLTVSGTATVGVLAGINQTTLGAPSATQFALAQTFGGAGCPVTGSQVQTKWLPITGQDGLVYYVPAWR